MSTEGKFIRAAQVLKLTGWSRSYLHKLTAEQVLKPWKPYPKAWPWYDRVEILRLLNGGETVSKS